MGVLRRSLLLVVIIMAAGLIAGCGQSDSETDKTTASDSTQTTKQLWTCGMHPDVLKEEPGECPICGMDLVPVKAQSAEPEQAQTMDMSESKPTTRSDEPRKILYWRAPMDPTFIRDKPGKSPMGMDLVPVYEGDETTSGGATVVIDPVTVQNIGVQTAVARQQMLSKVIRTVGHVDYNEESLNRINVKFSGWVEKLYVDETGQSIRKGQKLLDIYSPELVSTQQEYVLAMKNARETAGSSVELISESGSSLAEASRRRLEYWDFTEAQIEDLETTGVVKKTVTLYAPVSGYVIMKMAEEGMRIMPGMDLYRIADLSKVWVYAHLYDEDIEWVKVGQDVTIELPYTPGKTLKGRVDYIYPYLDQKARDTKVRIVLQNPGLSMRPNMYANVELRSSLPDPVVAIPGEAILRSGTRNVVFVDRGEGKFEPRDVVLGIGGNDGLVQVLAGIKAGERVVTSAQFLLDSESRLKEAIQKMLRERARAASGAK